MFIIIIAWCKNRPLHQLCHSHCPNPIPKFNIKTEQLLSSMYY